ncbi:MAG: transposase [Terracidiphilus sp.]|jgi:transposase
MTHPGVGPLTVLAYVLIIGSPERFRCGKQIGSFLGLIPCEDSSASRQRKPLSARCHRNSVRTWGSPVWPIV